MEVSSPLGEAKSPGDISMDTSTAMNSPEGMAYSLFQEQDMEMGESSNQGQLLANVKQEAQPTIVEQNQMQQVVQVVENNTPVQPQSFIQTEQKSVPEVNMGGIALNCGMDNNQAVQNLLSQLLNPLAQQGANGPQIIQAPDGTLQIINTNNGTILPNLPPSTNNITIPSDTNTAPATTPIVLQQPAGTTQPVLLNPNTILLNPGTTVSPQTIILNPFPVQNPPNNQAPGTNTTFLVAPANLTSGNTTILTNLNAAQLQTAVDANSGNNNPTVLFAPTNLGDPNTILFQPGTNTNVPATTASLATTGFSDVKPSTSLTRRSSGKTASQKTVQELLMEDEKKRVQVESKSLKQELEKNRDALALRLKLRRPRNELVNQGIIPSTAFKSSPAFHEQLQKLERAKVGDHLQKKMRMRPDKAHLVHQHILEDTNLDPLVNATQQMLKRARLEQDLDIKIKNRPGPLELIEDNILKPEGEVEQLVKDGGFKFIKTSVPDSDSPFTFFDNPDGSDDALSPPQPDTSTSDTQPSSVTSIPSPSDSLFFSDKLKPFHNNSAITSPSKAVSTTLSNIAIKQEQGVTSPPAGGTSPFSVLSSSQSSSSSKNSNRNQRKKQAKRSKPKEIKFHEYKPPNEQGSKAGSQPTLGNPYNLLLMQQQLYLQLQLLQQQQQQRIMPEQPSLPSSSNSNTVVTASITKLPSPTVQTVSVESSPSQSDTKSLTNNSSSTNTGTTTATSTTMTKTFSISNLEDMKVSELKAELKNRGLHVSGTKPQLVQRLRLAELREGIGSAASSPDVTSSSTTKVSSTTDVHTDSMSESNSNRQSLASPPISPEAKPVEPMSPSSPQFEPPTFQPIKTPSVSSPVSNPSSVTFQSPAPSQEQKKLEEMVMSPTTTSSASFPLRSPPPSVASTVGDSGSTSTDMVDLSDFRMHDAQLSSELLKKQQQKIEELQRALELSQMQLYRQQIGGSGMYNTPPPPPPPPPPPQNQILANRMHSSPPVTSDIQQFYPDLKLSSPPTTKPATFQGQDFAHTINQHPKVFSFASPPANGQPFQFTKSHPDLRAVHQANGIVTPRSSSLPSSPTEEAILELGSGLARSITTPNFMNPPPNYEEAVRQTNERKHAQMMGSPPPPPVQATSSSAPTTARSPVNSSNLSFDDLLEVLVGHGYPASGNIKKDKVEDNVHGSSPMNSPPPPSTAISGPSTVTTSFQRSLNEPVPSPGDLPMEVDHHDLSSLNHIMADKSKARYSIPSMQIDSTDPENSLLSLTLESGSPAENAFPGALSGDSDLNWLDLVLPSSSGTHSMGSNADNTMSTSFGKDPFALSLADLQDVNPTGDFHHLDSDVWDNIQVTD